MRTRATSSGRHRNEAVRRDQPLLRVFPTDKGLDPGGGARPAIDLRLVMKRELLTRNSTPQGAG